MKTMKWLIRREVWENKGAFFRAPLILSAVMIFFLLLTLGMGKNLEHLKINDMEYNHIGDAVSVGAGELAAIAEAISTQYMWFASPLFVMLSFVIFFYCLNALYEDRRNRSILFWKSLPISDTNTVLSKLITAVVVIPLVCIVVASATALIAAILGCVALSAKGIHVFGLVLSTPDFYLTPFELLAILPVYFLWALPTVGWLLMVSSWARSKVFLWAVGVPGLSVVLLIWAEKMFGFGLNIGWYMKNIVARLLLSIVPGGWLQVSANQVEKSFDLHKGGGTMSYMLMHSWEAIGSVDLWAGAVAGAVMIGVAIYMRRWREEA
ncbi:ABC-2 type transport system permease protein [Oxalobacteraceae bacterium GrIS 2.11]